VGAGRVSVLNDRQSFERMVAAMFPDLAIYALFKQTQEAKVMKGSVK
jgi:hypothetical protein